MIRGMSRLYRSGGSMLHAVTHHNKQWRQGGQLYCAFCMSAWRKADSLETLQTNPYFDKYKKKLQELQREAPEDFKAKIAKLDEKKQENIEAKEIDKEPTPTKSQLSQVRQKQLDKVLKFDLIEDKSAEEIAQIWNEFHKTKPVIFATIPAEEYKEMQLRFQEYPMFLYPIPRGDGYEFFLQKFSQNEAHFTPLIAYQQHNENAPSCLTMTHYTELMESKGIVLMVGEPDTNVLGIPESQLLALQLKLYYGSSSGTKFDYVKQMNSGDESFQHMDLIREFEGLLKDVNVTKAAS